ncbi:molybdenum cofactor biosynthesis prote [Pyrrhoderma noxium]|uniref:Molybdenum cofactor biosynthesis prote n=1 Tax=Pyrrhoderma noxium TaxID=2282107 RepID=A0A286UR50_9AGAM|nr:molybdenum cofactor biosynthesis prote [Pyrrhoderma noxium]
MFARGSSVKTRFHQRGSVNIQVKTSLLLRSSISSASEQLLTRARTRISEVDKHYDVPILFDNYQRRHDYLRISLTERCNLRCFYCMPSDGIELSPSSNILSDDEIIRLATLFVQNGVKKIRLTGGEPTVRKSIIKLIGRLNELRRIGLQTIAMTSNGLALHRKLPTLVENGLTHLNLSLDTLDPLKFEIMTRRQGHDAVLKALRSALENPNIQSVKLNVVVVRGLNEHEVPKFIELTREQALSIRFIEFMPFSGNKWDKQKMVPSAELLARLSDMYPQINKVSDEQNDTARSCRVAGYRGSFGFISSMSDHFCGSCNRLRITADGQIKVCLFDANEVSLRDLMRNGASDEALLRVIRAALKLKKEKHAGMEDIDVINNRPMIKIGDLYGIRTSSASLNSFLSGSVHQGRKAPSGLCNFSRCFTTSSQHYNSEVGSRLTHIDEHGLPKMVDVSEKAITQRSATAQGRIYIPKIAFDLIQGTETKPTLGPDTELEKSKIKSKSKGNVLTIAQLAGIMASKKTSDLIPLCHPLPLSKVAVQLRVEENNVYADSSGKGTSPYSIVCESTVQCEGKTGVEMEALSAVSVSLLTVWDMLKAVAGKEMIISDIHVTKKSGGRSGNFERRLPEQ